MKTTINLEELKALDPCDNGEAFEAVFGNKTVTFSQAAKVMEWNDVWWCIRELWDQFTKQQQDDIHLLGCDYAEEVLYIFEEEYPNDKRPRLAIEAKRKWVKGEISDKELEEVRSAAYSAARSAAESARAAAWSAWSTAESARAAARAAVRSAAESAAESAAGSAVWSAWAAAWAAAESVGSAARAAVRSAAESAAESAAVGSVRSAAWAARTTKQKDMLINVFIKWEESK